MADDETIDDNLTNNLVRGDHTAAKNDSDGQLSPGALDFCLGESYLFNEV